MSLEKLKALQASVDSTKVWAVLPSYHAAFKERLLASIASYTPVTEMPDEEKPAAEPMASTIAVIPLHGEIVQGTGLTEDACEIFGICDLDIVRAQLKEAAADDTVQMICLSIESPGGRTTGLKELGDLIAEVSQAKSIICFSANVMASAAYWIGSQCGAVFCAPTATLGSVGVYLERLDLTKQLDDAGVTVNLVADGKFKTEGHPATKMTPEEESRLQEEVSSMADMFRSAVNSRRTINADLLQGQTFTGTQAAENGFADGTANDLEDLLMFFAGAQYL